MKINIREVLEYFDTKGTTDYGDTTAAISVVCEDLGAALFKQYCESERASKVDIISANEEIPTTGRRIGPRLDRWIMENVGENKTLYQTEIKSWCSRAIGGMTIPVDIDDEGLLKLVIRNWTKNISKLNDDKINGLNKVLVDMPTDGKLERLGIKKPYSKEPLLIFWDARNPNCSLDCFSRYDIEKKHLDFNYCWIFSCSLYLRLLRKKGVEDIHVDIPNAQRRLADLARLFKI